MDAKGRAVRRCRAARWCLWRSGGGGRKGRGEQAGKGRGTVGEEWMSDGDASGAETAAAALAASAGWGPWSCTRVHSLRPPLASLPAPQQLISRSVFIAQPPAVQGHGGIAVEAGRERRKEGGNAGVPVGSVEGGRGMGRESKGAWGTQGTRMAGRGHARGAGEIGVARFDTDKGRPWETGGPSALSERGRESGVVMPRRYRRRYGSWAPAAGSGSAAHPGPRPARGR